MADVLIRLAMAIEAELGGHGRWHRLVVDETARGHREHAKTVGRLALRAIQDLDWPDVSAKAVSLDGTIAVVIPAQTVRNMVRRTIEAALQDGTGEGRA